MSRSKNPRHIYQQTTSSVWSIRLEPPKELKQLDPQAKNYRKSLGTRDARKAATLAEQLTPTIRKQWQLRIQQLKAIQAIPALADAQPLAQPIPKLLDSELITELLTTRTQSWGYTDHEERALGCDDEQIAGQQAHAQHAIAKYSQVTLRGAKASSWLDCVDEALDWGDTCGYAIDASDPQLNAYALAFAKNEFRLQKKILSIVNGEEIELIENYTPPDLSNPKETSEEIWFRAINDYTTHQEKSLTRKTLLTELTTINSLRDFLKNKNIKDINSKDIYQFFKFKLEKDNWSNDRVNRHGKNTFRKFFSICVTHSLSEKNPIDNLQILPQISKEDEETHRKPNKPLNDKQVSIILNSEWYTNKNLFRGSLSKDKGGRYWIPLILLFHGFRVTEACQLNIENIKIYDDIPCFDTRIKENILNNKKLQKLKLDLSSKTTSTQRIIPIHPKLLELGFMEFLKYNKNDFFIFPSSLPEENSKIPKIGRAFEQAFLRFIKTNLKLGDGFGNHSFRHLLEDKIRAANTLNNVWPAGVSQQYMGRSFKDVDNSIFKSQGSASDYGNGYPPKNILKCIETLDFSKINLPPSYNNWLKNIS